MNSLGFAGCREDLTAVATILNQFELQQSKTNAATLSNLRTLLKWPRKKEEIVDLFQKIERHKTTINMAVMADNLYQTQFLSPYNGSLTCRLVKLRCRCWTRPTRSLK